MTQGGRGYVLQVAAAEAASAARAMCNWHPASDVSQEPQAGGVVALNDFEWPDVAQSGSRGSVNAVSSQVETSR